MNDILAEAAGWELQFDMAAPYNQTKEQHFPVDIGGHRGNIGATLPGREFGRRSCVESRWCNLDQVHQTVIEFTRLWEDNITLGHSEKHAHATLNC